MNTKPLNTELVSFLIRLVLNPIDLDAFLDDPQKALSSEFPALTKHEIDAVASRQMVKVRGVLGGSLSGDIVVVIDTSVVVVVGGGGETI